MGVELQDLGCPFCGTGAATPLLIHEHALALRDQYPMARGHTLIVPKLHVASLFELPELAQAGIWHLVADVRRQLIEEFNPDGFNIGLNDGVAAGQTVMHAHVHVIPRYTGDVADPRGGIRWVIPARAPYWREER